MLLTAGGATQEPRSVILFSSFSCSTIGEHPKKDLALNGNRTGKAVDFFCIPAFIWRPTGEGLLNLAKPAQILYFFGDLFQIFKESVTGYSFEILFFAFWRNFAQIKKSLAQIGYRFGGGKKCIVSLYYVTE
jgi:hypothetical protein